jgi:hypothetical protein
MQETDLECREKELADGQAQGLYPPGGRDLPSEIGKLCERVEKVEDDHAVEAEQLLRSTMEISNTLVDLNELPIQGIPSQTRLVKDVMVVFSLVLERLCEEVPVREPDA